MVRHHWCQPALGFGLLGLLHDIHGELPSNEERFVILDHAYKLGARLWDSAGTWVTHYLFQQGEAEFSPNDVCPVVQPRFLEANRAHNVSVADQFGESAERKHCSVSWLTIAWLLKQGGDIIPFPSTKIKYLEDNWKALKINMTHQEEAEIRGFSDKNKLAGAIAPEKFLSYIFCNTKEES
ncbi:hypothetical protein E0Z10_g3983 [Xylaria hypoxylon]|uniref:NADP-dependent oxidoreductase domain-containing protein n=1 Tax=Xylaria hypoxylon TaxID=37992 RepID=A0A4Z0Z0D2_9PEZI|nr:hypothetical protein E0Z10_g3983 [Xylaria hypoxylon]